MTFPRVTIHKSTCEKLVMEYARKRRTIQLVFSTHNGRILAYPDEADDINPGSWFYLGFVLSPVYDDMGNFLGCASSESSEIRPPNGRDDKPNHPEKVLYEIVIVDKNLPQDVSLLRWMR